MDNKILLFPSICRMAELNDNARFPSCRPPSELVDIICSQVEVEQDQAAQNPDAAVGDPMDVIDEEEEEDEGTIKTEAPRNAGWTRGPTQLRYDDDLDDENDDANEEETSQAADQEDQPTEAGEAGANDAGGKGPLRLRGGGLGLPRAKAKSVRPTRSATAPEPSSSVPLPGSSSESGGGASTAGSKRPAPTLDSLTKRQAPLRAPGGLRRSRSTPGGTGGGGFKPPRALSTAVNLATIGQVGATGRADGARGDGDGASTPTGDGSPRSGARESLKVAAAAAAESSAGDGDSNDENSSSDTQEGSSNTEERSQVVVPGWESQGRHPVEYRGGRLNLVSTSQLRTSPNLARGIGGRTASEASETGSVGSARKKQKVFEDEGDGRGGGADGESAVSQAAAGMLDGRGVRSGAADSRPSDTLVAGDAVEASGLGTPSLGRESQNVDGGFLGIPPRAEVDARQGQGRDDRRDSPGGSGTETVDIEGRFRRADARLGLTPTRPTPSPSQRHAFATSAHGSVNNTTSSYPVSSVDQGSGATPRKAGADQVEVGVLTDQVRGSTSGSSPPVGTAPTQDSLEAPWRGQGQEAEPAEGSLLDTADHRDYDLGISSSPLSASALAAASGLPTPTPPLPPASDWGRSPATPLSAQSDSSDMPPLGQPSPGLLTTATRDAAAAAGGGGLSGAGSSGGQRGVGDKGGASERSPSTPGRFFLSAGSGSTAGSPARGRCSGFTPPTPRPREGGRGSGAAVLRPPERPPAPDPAVCAAALSRLGVPQVSCVPD